MTLAMAPWVSDTGQNVLIAIIAAVLGAPFLNFILSLTRAKVDRNNVIVTGAGSTVTAMGEAVERLRAELTEVAEDNKELRAELDEQDRKHRAEMAQIRAEHRQEVANINAGHRAQMAELRAQRDDQQQMIRRLEALVANRTHE